MDINLILILTSLIIFIVGVILLITGSVMKSKAKTDKDLQTGINLVTAGTIMASLIVAVYAVKYGGPMMFMMMN